MRWILKRRKLLWILPLLVVPAHYGILRVVYASKINRQLAAITARDEPLTVEELYAVEDVVPSRSLPIWRAAIASFNRVYDEQVVNGFSEEERHERWLPLHRFGTPKEAESDECYVYDYIHSQSETLELVARAAAFEESRVSPQSDLEFVRTRRLFFLRRRSRFARAVRIWRLTLNWIFSRPAGRVTTTLLRRRHGVWETLLFAKSNSCGSNTGLTQTRYVVSTAFCNLAIFPAN